jgi:tetratricopeptide (TPR) repeat protein
MKHMISLALCIALGACASAAPPAAPGHLFADDSFAAPSQRIDPDDVFALSDAMREYAAREMAPLLRSRGMQQGLVDALYTRGQLRLEYDAALTRNAAQAFDARAGNCLSLVIMTAAFAKHLGMPVRYRSVLTEPTWSREGDLYFVSHHVNLSLAKRPTEARIGYDASHLLTIDFLPAQDLRGHRTKDISERTILAMYMNNRAAESLARGRLDDAYGWAREAVVQDPAFLRGVNTLAVTYLRHGKPAHAERALQHVLAFEPRNTQALANLQHVLQALGRHPEAARVAAQLAQLEPHPPFHFYHLGRAALEAGDLGGASAWFAREIERDAYHHEFHFWRAVALFGLGQREPAARHLALAQEYSPTRLLSERYAAKLERLRAVRIE